MRVVIGPVSVPSANAWLDYAEEVLGELASMAPGECFTTPEVLEVFRAYVASWREAAVGTEMVWERDIRPEQVEYDMHAFQRVAQLLAQRAEEHGLAAPPEGEDFYVAVLQGVLAALDAEGPSSAAYAEHLAEFWPGRDPLG
jgi:hypothetical protein